MSQWTLPPFFDISSAEFLTLKAERAAGNWAASALSGVLDGICLICTAVSALRRLLTGTVARGRPSSP
jgi:hypothetical protein